MNLQQKFFDVYYQPGECPVFCYRSGLAVYEEQLRDGVLVSAGYNAAGYPLDVLSGYPSRISPEKFTEPAAFHLDLDGVSLEYGLTFVDFLVEKTEEERHDLIKDAYNSIFTALKPNDFAVAGIFQKYHDQLTENVTIFNEWEQEQK